MPSLAETQQAFAGALVDPAKSVPDVIRPSTEALRGARQSRRFDVYRNNIAVAVIDGLAETFAAVQQLVGKDFFRAVARAYLDECPPGSPLLFRHGATFADFLDTFPPARRVPYLADVARLEFARLQAYHAADQEPVPLARLAGYPADQLADLRLIAHPSTHLVRSTYPVASLWAACAGTLASPDVDMTRPEAALITRPDLNVKTIILPPGGGAFLEACLGASPLGDAAGQAATDSAGFDLSVCLACLFESGAFADITPVC